MPKRMGGDLGFGEKKGRKQLVKVWREEVFLNK